MRPGQNEASIYSEHTGVCRILTNTGSAKAGGRVCGGQCDERRCDPVRWRMPVLWLGQAVDRSGRMPPEADLRPCGYASRVGADPGFLRA